jgi:hypothetical protein
MSVEGFVLHRRISQLVPLGISIGFLKKRKETINNSLQFSRFLFLFLIDSILLYHQPPKNHKKEEMAPRHTRGSSSTTLSFFPFFFFFSFLSGKKSRGIYEAIQLDTQQPPVCAPVLHKGGTAQMKGTEVLMGATARLACNQNPMC